MHFRKLIFIILLPILLINGCVKQNQLNLPDSFTLRVYGDWSSSGGDRFFDSRVNFENGKASSGWLRYNASWYDTETLRNANKTVECLVDSSKLVWIDKNTNGDCVFSNKIPLDKEQIEEKITSQEFEPSDECLHYDACYEII